jgi:hypothetical protein
MPMGTFMMAISKTIRLMALVFTNIIMAQFTKAPGNSMLTTGKESNPKVMAPNITGISRMVKSMVRDTKYLQTGQPFKESGIKAWCMARASTNGQMAGRTREAGNIMIWMAMGNLRGTMEDYILVCSKKIKGMGKEYNNGLMEGFMMDNGSTASSTEEPVTKV